MVQQLHHFYLPSQSASGPEPPLADVSDAAVQLHHTCHSFNAQQFREASDGSAENAA